MPNFETAEGRRIWQRRFGLLPDVRAQLALHDRFEERAHFVLFAGREKFDAPVAQISHGASDVESLCDLPDGVAKTNALNVAFVENLDGSCHAIRRLIRPAPAATTARSFYCPGVGAGSGASESGKFSGGGTRRGSLEFKLNCSPAGRFDVAAAINVDGAGLMSSLAM